MELRVWNALQATFFTWALTAAGAAMVFVLPAKDGRWQRQLLDSLLGFAAGVMTAASFWSLLQPAIELAEKSAWSGPDGRYAIVPVSLGFALGGGAMFAADALLQWLGVDGEPLELMSGIAKKNDDAGERPHALINGGRTAANGHDRKGGRNGDDDSSGSGGGSGSSTSKRDTLRPRRNPGAGAEPPSTPPATRAANSLTRTTSDMERGGSASPRRAGLDSPATPPPAAGAAVVPNAWRRVMLLVIAITVHNFPEGLAVGVGYGSIGSVDGATYRSARTLALGIGLQNFPEGMAVSMPLRREGMSFWQSFFWGQISGVVEPLGGLLGAYAVLAVQPILPYALSFAAGAMMFVVVDQLIPEAHSSGYKTLATTGFMAGFVVMMAMDVTLG